MAWEIIIGGTALTIDEHANFNLRSQATYNDADEVEFVETFIEVEGEVVDSTPSDVTDGIINIRNQVANASGAVTVELKLDSVQKFNFTPSTSLNGPQVRFFETKLDEGASDSHWGYRLSIYVKTKDANKDDNVTEIDTSIEVIKEGTKVVRKIWNAAAKGKTLQDALTFVKGFRPNDEKLTESIKRQFNQQRVIATWVWETRKQGQVITILEDPIQVTQFGDNYVGSKQVGGADKGPRPAILHRARLNPFRIVITGRVQGQDPNQVKNSIPGPHFTENANRKRQRAEELPPQDPVLVDPIKGIYSLPYREVWISVETKIPKAKHTGHKPTNPPDCIPAPADGPMAQQGT